MQRAPSHYQPILQDISTYPTLRRRLLLLLTLGGKQANPSASREGWETSSTRPGNEQPRALSVGRVGLFPSCPAMPYHGRRPVQHGTSPCRPGWPAPSHPPYDLRGGARDLSPIMAGRQNPYCMAWHKLWIYRVSPGFGGGGLVHTHPVTSTAGRSSQTWIESYQDHPPVQLSWVRLDSGHALLFWEPSAN